MELIILSIKMIFKVIRNHLNSLKNKTSSEWREYATQCMIEIMNHIRIKNNLRNKF